MPLKKPSEYFGKDIITVNNSVQKLDNRSELNTFSDAFESFKNNLNKIEVLSEFSETLDNYRVNIKRVNHLSEKVEDIQTEIQTLLKKEDLDRAMMSQLIVVEQSIRDVQSKVKSINESNLTEIRSDVSDLTKSVNEFLEIDVPKYKKLVVESELRTNDRYEKLEENINETLGGIGEFVENKYQELTESLQGINEKSLAGILEEFKSLDKIVLEFKNKELPKYKKVIVETEVKTDSKLKEFQEKFDETVFNILEKVSLVEGDKNNLTEVVNEKIEEVKSVSEKVVKYVRGNQKISEDYKKQISAKVTDLEVEIIRNESHIKTQNKNIEQIKDNVEGAIQKLNIEEIEKQNYELSQKIKYLEEIFEKFNEKEILTENIITEPPETKNSDPLTPLNQNYVTVKQLQDHYRVFVNRIQQQLSTLGGGGETRLKYLDDIVGIATNPSVYDGKFLRYNHSIGKFEFVTITQGGGGGNEINGIAVDTSNLTGISTNYLMIYDPSVPGFKFVNPQTYFGINNDANPDPLIDDFGNY